MEAHQYVGSIELAKKFVGVFLNMRSDELTKAVNAEQKEKKV